ncbi:MAG: hypothetical protein RJA70_4989 [Pseudomonadota bacterium]
MWLWDREQNSKGGNSDDWFPPMQFALARLTLGLLVITYFALWPREPVLDAVGAQAWLELPRLGRGLLRLAALTSGLLLVLGWGRRIAALSGAALSLVFGLNGRADPSVSVLLFAALVWIALPQLSEPLRVIPFNQDHQGTSWPRPWWVRSRWFVIGIAGAVAPWMGTPWLQLPGLGSLSLLLLVALIFVAVRGPSPAVAAGLALLLTALALFTAGPAALPIAAWCLFFCLDNAALPPLPPPKVPPNADPTELDEPLSLVVFFDGVCGLCQASIQLVLEEDRRQVFLFAPLQGPSAERWLGRTATDPVDSIEVYEAGRTYDRSTGALRIAGYLGGMWRLFSWARIIPADFRDQVYDFIADHRYAWFGKLDACRIPTPSERARFLD